MRLADRFLNFAARLKKNGASFLDSEPDALPSLVRAARHDVDEMAAALYAPIAPETWSMCALCARSASARRIGSARAVSAYPSMISISWWKAPTRCRERSRTRSWFAIFIPTCGVAGC